MYIASVLLTLVVIRGESLTSVDILERNTFISGGRVQIVQWIGWEWSVDYGRSQVVFWRFVESTDVVVRDELRFWSGGVEYRVRYGGIRVTETEYDPERVDVAWMPVERRMGLMGVWRCGR